MATIPCTGATYLVIGNGFLGQGLVRCLLDRGETNIRVFDIAPSTVWDGHPHVTFVRGNVTKLEDISKACEGVQVVYSTFAIIRFMDRLDFQARLSYDINVGGIETLIKALRTNSCDQLVMTSSSNVCSTLSDPIGGVDLPASLRARRLRKQKTRLGHYGAQQSSNPSSGLDLDETAPYATPETAPHHYSWTKAVAEQKALEADGVIFKGKALKVVVVRPCGAVVGGDDVLTYTRVLDLGMFSSMGSWRSDGFSAKMDYTYVDNVLLGHLLAEKALREERPGVHGEAFNIGNDDAVSAADLARLFNDQIGLLSSANMRKRLVLHWFCMPWWILCPLTWGVESFKRVTRGSVTLPKTIDLLTPALVQHMNLGFTYSSSKARQRLGYAPVFSVEEGIQRSLHVYHRMRYGGSD